jgi:glycosyltransferase involved in cell wall biosynthesis
MTATEHATAPEGSKPRVSIALPVYNGERYLAVAVESILGQTFDDFELLISDNASTDATEEIARDFASRDERIRYVRQERNLGAGPNFNAAMRLTRADFVKWASFDDALAPGYLQACVDLLDEHPDAPYAHTAAMHINEQGEELGVFDLERRLEDPDPVARFRAVLSAYDFHSVFALARRSAAMKTGLLYMYSGSDRYYLADLLLQGRPRYAEEPLFRWRVHDESFRNRENKSKDDAVAWWATDVGGWPLRNTVHTTAHGLQVTLLRAPSFRSRVACTTLLLRQVVGQTARIAARRAAAVFRRSGRAAQAQ